MFHNLPIVGPKQLCVSTHLGCTLEVGVLPSDIAKVILVGEMNFSSNFKSTNSVSELK